MKAVDRLIYFDNAATSRVRESAAEAAASTFRLYANPSSNHRFGSEAAAVIKSSRAAVASALGCLPEELIFTSGGTEANNMAVMSHAAQNRRAGKLIVTDGTEHPSVSEAVKRLEKDGYKAVCVPVEGGEPDYAFLGKSSADACLVTLMQVNNQTGCVFDMRKIREAMTAAGSKAMLHCDAVQGFLKTSASEASKLTECCDTVSVSAHKVGGLKGCGALYVKHGVKIRPLIVGGEQEGSLRGGTENITGIAAFGAAVSEAVSDKAGNGRVKTLRELFVSCAKDVLGDRISFFVPENHIEGIISISLDGLRSEVCLNYLSSLGIYVSASSACSARAKDNPVLAAYGLPKSYTDCALRIAFSPFNTEDEVRTLVSALSDAMKFSMKRR